MVTIRIYLDESEGDIPFIAAGWACRAEKWDVVSESWPAVLNAPPAIPYFKLNDAMGFKGPFEGWSDTARDEKVKALARTLPHEAGFFAHGCYVSRFDFVETVKDHVRPIFRRPYFFCVAAAIVTAAGRGPNKIIGADKLDFVLDRSKDAMLMQKLFYSEIKPRFTCLGECTHLDDKETYPLQAADLCAGILRQFHESSPRSLPGTDELDGIPALTVELRQKDLRDMISTPLFRKRKA